MISLKPELYTDADGMEWLKLVGVCSPYVHVSRTQPLSGHQHGMHFSVACGNMHPCFDKMALWNAFWTEKEAALIAAKHDPSMPIVLVGGSYPSKDNEILSASVYVKTTKSPKGELTIHSVECAFPLIDYYDQWVQIFIEREVGQTFDDISRLKEKK
jgi:hypothetical protein